MAGRCRGAAESLSSVDFELKLNKSKRCNPFVLFHSDRTVTSALMAAAIRQVELKSCLQPVLVTCCK